MQEQTDRQLVALALAGETAAFGQLVRRHQALLRNWLKRLSADQAAADDIAQEAFLQAWKQLGAYRGEGEFKSWLLKIAYRCFLLHLRKQQQFRNLQEAAASDPKEQESQESDPGLPDLSRLLSILSFEERACTLLAYSHGYSHNEISDLLDLPLGTVKSHLRRSILRIRERFGIEV